LRDPQHLQQGIWMSVDIGGRLRFIRSRQKLSQRKLAKRSGVTNSTISLIESNQTNVGRRAQADPGRHPDGPGRILRHRA
jgi:DNA-binding XRE family transcriptional regulator